jgi:hypothetical protein
MYEVARLRPATCGLRPAVIVASLGAQGAVPDPSGRISELLNAMKCANRPIRRDIRMRHPDATVSRMRFKLRIRRYGHRTKKANKGLSGAAA